MIISMIAAVSKNGVIGSGADIPWSAKGEQLLFKAMTYNQWLLVGRKTFKSMGKLPNRQYAVVSRSLTHSDDPDVDYFTSVEKAMAFLDEITSHVFVAGGGEVYAAMIDKVDTLHLSVIHTEVQGDVVFPTIPDHFRLVFSQYFESNQDYTYRIYQNTKR